MLNTLLRTHLFRNFNLILIIAYRYYSIGTVRRSIAYVVVDSNTLYYDDILRSLVQIFASRTLYDWVYGENEKEKI